MWWSTRGGAAGGRGHVEAVGRQPGDDAVVEDEAVLLQHQPIAASPGCELGPCIDVEPVRGIRRRRGRRPRSCRAWRRRTSRRIRAPPGIRARPPPHRPRPSAGKYQARRHCADILEGRALRLRPAVDRRACGGDRTARRARGRRARRRSPAYRAAGRWSGPTSGIVLSSAPASRPSAFMLEVLPWSVAMPVVV